MLLLQENEIEVAWFFADNIMPRTVIVNDRDKDFKDICSHWGIEHVEDLDNDYALCVLPAGWHKAIVKDERDSDPAWAHLLDDKGRTRANMLCRPPHPHIVPIARFVLETESDSGQIFPRYRYKLTDCGKVIKLGQWHDREQYRRITNKALETMDRFLPDWKNPFAHWDEPDIMSSLEKAEKSQN